MNFCRLVYLTWVMSDKLQCNSVLSNENWPSKQMTLHPITFTNRKPIMFHLSKLLQSKKWYFIRVDRTSVDLTSGMKCTNLRKMLCMRRLPMASLPACMPSVVVGRPKIYERRCPTDCNSLILSCGLPSSSFAEGGTSSRRHKSRHSRLEKSIFRRLNCLLNTVTLAKAFRLAMHPM